MVNYNKGKIYKIESHLGPLIYIGSTTKTYLSQRIDSHRHDYKLFKDNYTDKKMTSFQLFDAYGVDNCNIVLIELVNCNSKDELLAREAYHIKNNKCVNKIVPLRTDKEYYQDTNGKDKKRIQYNLTKEKVNCYCGGCYTNHKRAQHFKTKLHMNAEKPV